ncbi:glycosyltransferase family 2 protein [Bauldia sp.]|uniref:glycosyltransferase family 2 protein n=1 Tax=Bauldia sp. TaxID=2575872 RepID=UPI003BABA7D5
MTKVCITICTAGRPRMLADCLHSVADQEPPEDCSVTLVVIDNNPTPQVGEIVRDATADARFPVALVHEAEPGIPHARNRGLIEALARGADWIVCIDDDEIADAGWLKNLIAAGETHQADVVQGKLVKIYPDRLPLFVMPTNYPDRNEGQPLDVAYTHNVAFRSWLVAPDRGNLRFDEGLRFTGGSDSHFFRRARKIGAKIVATDKSVVRETQVPERLSLKWQLRREYRVGAGMARSETTLGVPRRQRRRKPGQLVFRIVRMIVTIILSPLMLVFGFERFEATVAAAIRKLAASLGALSAHLGRLPTPYRKLDGH